MGRVFLRLVVLCFFLFFFLSCSDSVPEIAETNVSFVMDYKTKESLPEIRLSVFVQPTTDVGRVSHIDVRHVASGLLWRIDNPMVLNGSKKYMAGSPFLMPPYYDGVPKGPYVLTYEDLAGRFVQTEFEVSYPQDFLSMQVPQIESFAQETAAPEKIAVYSGEKGTGVLLYYGERKEDWFSNEKIMEAYAKAMSIRTCYELQGEAVLCLLPPQNLR